MTVAVTIVTVDCGQYYSELGATVVDCIANIWEQDVHQVNNYKHKHGQNPGSFLVLVLFIVMDMKFIVGPGPPVQWNSE